MAPACLIPRSYTARGRPANSTISEQARVGDSGAQTKIVSRRTDADRAFEIHKYLAPWTPTRVPLFCDALVPWRRGHPFLMRHFLTFPLVYAAYKGTTLFIRESQPSHPPRFRYAMQQTYHICCSSTFYTCPVPFSGIDVRPQNRRAQNVSTTHSVEMCETSVLCEFTDY